MEWWYACYGKSLVKTRLTSVQQDNRLVTDLQNQISQLEEKIDSLEGQIRDKDLEVERLQVAGKDKDNVSQHK